MLLGCRMKEKKYSPSRQTENNTSKMVPLAWNLHEVPFTADSILLCRNNDELVASAEPRQNKWACLCPLPQRKWLAIALAFSLGMPNSDLYI